MHPQSDPAKHVDPFIGTGGTGHTFPGAVYPFGMVQVSPDTDRGEWRRCSGYHATDSTILGFSLTHLSGTGNGDLGDVMLMPVIGKLYRNRGSSVAPDTTYRSRFRQKTERADPGYYRVILDDYDIEVELTCSKRVGFHRYTMPASDSAHIIMDLTHRIERDKGKQAWTYFQYDDNQRISGYSISHGWAKDRRVYWAIEVSRPFTIPSNKRVFAGDDLRAIMHFTTEEGEQIMVKAAYSPVSIANARDNLQEIEHWNFDKIRQETRQAWNEALSTIKIEAPASKQKLFYTSLYHTMIHPSLFMDRNGEYRSSDNAVHQAKKFEHYTIFSLWDTYRALHPLFTLIQAQKNRDFVYSMLSLYENSPYRMLPMWSLHGYETWTMIGYHAIPVITDAYLKKIIDPEDGLSFLKAMVETATNHPYGGIDEYLQYGYLPVTTKTKEPVSMTLEYAYDDWCIAIMADALGQKETASSFFTRSKNYQHLFDSTTRFMRAKDTLGNWATRSHSGKFNPFLSSWRGDYTEGNAWQYSWYVPHDIPQLIAMMGGTASFREKLDSLFIARPPDKRNSLRDVTGQIGQYAHGNEPSHHIAYLYNYVGKPAQTQEKIDYILKHFYLPERDGIIGNEDCGQMSAWYVFSSLGFYPVNPASGVYVIGKPDLEKATIYLDNGQHFTTQAINLSPENIYIERVERNGKAYSKNWIGHNDILQGGKFTFYMTNKPSDWGTEITDRPIQSIYK